MNYSHFPDKQGLYDPQFEHDSCGVGFICNIKGEKSYKVVKNGINILERLSHRGAVGADPKTGDGAGILIQMPHNFLLKECKKINIPLPEYGNYGTGLIFLPNDAAERAVCKGIFEKVISQEGEYFLGWRDVPVNSSVIGNAAKDTMPHISQVFIKKSSGLSGQLAFERKLYIIRKEAEKAVTSAKLKEKKSFYIVSLSSRTISYKGLLMPNQLGIFFLDLKDTSIVSALCLVHSRYSTNTFPTWDLAQPFRFLAHNGEINTLRGNINWMRARERSMQSEIFGDDIEKIKPVIVEGGSDSAVIDNVFELLCLSGRSLAHSMMMLIPSAWEYDNFMSQKLKDFYRFHACFMEPWDGPAAIAFTDGEKVGAVLDRNGLRPARYIVTKQGFVIMASEIGVIDIDPADIKHSGRLEPGKIFLIDTKLGRIIDDKQIKKDISQKAPYGKWNKKNMVELDSLVGIKKKRKKSGDLITRLKAFGYTREGLKEIIKPMAEKGKEPIGSMGNDTPHAIFSKKPQLLYNYFKQLFAQVTNPPIDPIREKLVMSLESFIGPSKNILQETPKHSHKLVARNPIFTNEDIDKISNISVNNFKTKTIRTLFSISGGRGAFSEALERICHEAERAIGAGYSFIILSDRGADKDNAALPMLLAVSALHQHLVRKATRQEAGIIVESAEPREVHHLALLFGYGADCVNPYLAYEAVEYLVDEKELLIDKEKALGNYRKALTSGMLKILSKMGISTLRSYRGAQIFEALGLHDTFVEKYFTGTVSRIQGVGLEEITDETIARHEVAYPERGMETAYLSSGGIYQWKKDGEFHLWNPESIAALQDAVRGGGYERYKEFANLINDQSENPTTLRSLFKFSATEHGGSAKNFGGKKIIPIPLEEVEPAADIMKRFATGAMSFGSISRGAHETIAIAMNRIGAKSNTGEGGEDPGRFVTLPNGDSKRSAIKQVASGRFGVNINYLVNADEIQIKIAQGAKPGEGGQLPGHKVSEIIARTRYTTPGVTLISPPPHHDIYSIEDLAQLIFDLKNANNKARISVKLVSEIGVGTVAAGVAKGHADMILISGGDGGTGASPKSSIMNAGLPWELGLSETHQTLMLNNLRQRVRLQTDGQLRTGRDVAIAALLGAEEFGFCTVVLVAMGCVMLRHCHLNNCSVGVATQDDILQKRFKGRPEYIVNYFHFVTEELRAIMASLGVRTINDMVGRTDLLELDADKIPLKAKGIDYSRILFKPEANENSARYYNSKNRTCVDDVLDKKLIQLCEGAFLNNEPVEVKLDINNANRSVGAMLSGEVCRRCGDGVLLDDTITCRFKGIAGQSFGAFLARGIKFELEGMANDYTGKGISGGKIIIYPDKKSSYEPDENIIIGNTAFYGAVSGEAYICGIAGERFCIRNSGLYAVVEGVGDHGCEYMTGGRVVVLGNTGRNFAAGMSGGIAYIYDPKKVFKAGCNMDMVEVEALKEDDKVILYNLTRNHFKYTGSKIAGIILRDMQEEIKKFVRVIPIEYKRILEGVRVEQKLGLGEASDG